MCSHTELTHSSNLHTPVKVCFNGFAHSETEEIKGPALLERMHITQLAGHNLHIITEKSHNFASLTDT